MRRSSIILLSLAILLSLSGILLKPKRVSSQETGLIVIIDGVKADQYASEVMIQAYITVRHPQGGAITELGPEAFTIELANETYVPSDVYVEAEAPVSLGIVLELFRTMEGQPFNQAKAAIAELFTTKPPRDRVGFFGVRPNVAPDSDEIEVDYEMGFSNDGGAVNNFVQSSVELVTSGDGTALFDTLVKAIRLTAREPVGRSAIVVITDGGDVGSRYTAETVIDAAEKLRIPIYSIGYTGNNRIKDQFLNELANRTGGRYQDTPDAEVFGQFVQDVRQDMSQHYLLTIRPKDLESGRQVLEVRVEAGGLVGRHSKHFDIQVSLATPLPPSSSTDPEPVPLVADAPTSSTDPSSAPTPIRETTNTGGTLLDTIQDNPNMVAAIAGGLLLFFVVLIIIAILMGRRKREPEPTWDAGPEGYSSGLSRYDSVSEADPGPAAFAANRSTEPEIPAGTQVAPADPAIASPPVGGIVPPVPAPGRPGQGGITPAATDGTLILDRGPRMTRQALLVDSQRPEVRYDLNKPIVTVGRSADNDVVLDNVTISRHHATVKLEQEAFRVYDLGSSNGTFVNEQQVIEPLSIADGDTMRLGEMIFIFKVITLSA